MEELKTDPADTEQEAQIAILYAIDSQWHEEHQLSLAHLVRLRRCHECRESGFILPAERGKSRKRASAGALRSWEEEMRAIGDCCSGKPGYITPQTSLLEAAFRLLLQNGNQPVSAQELYDGIREWWAGLEYLRELNLPALSRLLEHQDSYGVRPVSSRQVADASLG